MKGGEGNIWKQQWSRAQHLGLGEEYDPRKEMLISLVNLLSKYPDHELIIGGDFNGLARANHRRKDQLLGSLRRLMLLTSMMLFTQAPSQARTTEVPRESTRYMFPSDCPPRILSTHRLSGVTTQFSLAITARSSWILMHGGSLMHVPSPPNRVGPAFSGSMNLHPERWRSEERRVET